MFVIAGPPGAGKSSVFSLNRFAKRTFNADDRAAEVNSGSYQYIPLALRAIVNREFEKLVRVNIRSGNSFALEDDASQFNHVRSGEACQGAGTPHRAGAATRLPTAGIRPVKPRYGEFTPAVSETWQPLSFPAQAV